MDIWQKQRAFLAVSGAPWLEAALDQLHRRAVHLRSLGHACDGLERVLRADLWVKASQTGINDLLSVRVAVGRAEGLESTLCFELAWSMANVMLLEDSIYSMDLMARVMVDGMFGHGDTIALTLTGRPDRHVDLSFALRAIQYGSTAITCATGLHYELASSWPVRSCDDLAPFFRRLMQRYGRFAEEPLFWPAVDDRLQKAGLIDLQVHRLHQDVVPFADLCEHQAGRFMSQAARETLEYQALEAFWNSFLGRSWLSDGTWLLGRMLSQMLDDPDALCNPWGSDRKAVQLTQRLAKQRQAQRRGTPAPGAGTTAPGPAAPSAAWPGGIPNIVRLYSGVAPVSYGWLMFQHDDGDYANFDAFRGQRNGLVGAAQPGVLVLNVGQSHGAVRLGVFSCPQEPPQPPERWQEVVEVSLVLPEGAQLRVQNLGIEEEFEEALDLPAGTWRVRVVAADFASEGEDSNGKPLERYALVFWPEPAWREDAVFRQHAPGLMERHKQAQAGQMG